ncbi:acyl-CoA dehydrogenase family protein [Parafrankia sp. EUN1f]|uniref:acyl-CoA dehydrogenase family protein n=1 Tax=Parafrankia sp. EUN1f TaxID=102897 RepID=UPI0001C44734|nr:acyl-CoA dehydrogenase family protein [Parafrankia sp. EUN1f]EFC82975.1 acyl-CoA dehydrogenase domain protein [Parafrankia sp. EUN1f]
MTSSFSTELEELRSAVRSFLDDTTGESAVRAYLGATGEFDRTAWSVLAEQLGLLGLAIPEEYGGADHGFTELAVVFEEMGRVLYGGPFLATVAAGQAILLVGDAAASADLLPAIASGQTVATLAVAERDGRWEEASVQTRATRTGDGAGDGGAGWRLDGTKMFVLDGCAADLILVAARTDRGVGLFAVDGTTAGTAGGSRRTPLATLDQTRKQARIDLDGVEARLIGAEGAGWAAVEGTYQRVLVALAAEQVGGAARALDMAVDYARSRFQFGRPVGSFQSIKHKCADVLIEVESARSAAYAAAAAAATDDPELPLLASLAAAYCTEAHLHAASENIQIHGGIGFTWEHPAHLYFKRASSARLMFGDPTYHRERVAQLIPE